MKKWLRWALLAAGAGCLLLGVRRGEQGVVLQKAVRVCLECIGVG